MLFWAEAKGQNQISLKLSNFWGIEDACKITGLAATVVVKLKHLQTDDLAELRQK